MLKGTLMTQCEVKSLFHTFSVYQRDCSYRQKQYKSKAAGCISHIPFFVKGFGPLLWALEWFFCVYPFEHAHISGLVPLKEHGRV